MRTIIAAAALVASLASAGAAGAQNWNYPAQDRGRERSDGFGSEYRGENGGGYGGGYARQICSGQRAFALEAKLQREWREGEIDPRAARRIKDQIDRLEDKQRDECREGDWRELREISVRYDRIEQWIEREAHSDWNRHGDNDRRDRRW